MYVGVQSDKNFVLVTAAFLKNQQVLKIKQALTINDACFCYK